MNVKRPAVLALLAAGIGVGSLASIAATSLHAATTDTTSTTTATASTDTSPPRERRAEHLSDMASLLGITTDQLQTELNSGKEFYQIAAAHGVTYDEVIAKSKADYQAKLDDMVKVGYITQAQADTFMKNWETRSAESPMLGLGGHGHGRMGM